MAAHEENVDRRTVRLFRNGRSQAVRIPKEFELAGDEVTIEKVEDGGLKLMPVHKKPSLLEMLASLEPLPEEDRMPEIVDFPPEPVDLK